MAKKVSIPDLWRMKAEGQKITMVTAYDYTFARLIEEAEVEMILVGDSLGMVMQGMPNTLAVTLDEVIYHARLVSRGVRHAHLMVDMPFLSYQASVEQAMQNAGRILKETAGESVKLEGGMEEVETVRRLTAAGIPVMAHIGLRPQSIHRMGGFVVQGRKEEGARQLLEEAKAFAQAGAMGILLEGIPAPLAKKITEAIRVPTIGIGAGPACDGQVLVMHDLLGLDKAFQPKFARRFAHLHETVVEAVNQYKQSVRTGQFPGEENTYT